MKENRVTYTIQIRSELTAELETYAKKLGKKQSEVIEAVVTKFLEDRIKKEMAASFERMKGDPELEFFAEAGLEDFLKTIEDYENS